MALKRAWIALFLLLTLTLSGQFAVAQTQFKVVEVEVEGNRIASKSLILGVSSIDIGSPLTPTISSETIRRLYGLNIFSDVSLEAEEVTGGLKVYIIVKELPKLSGLEITGNKKLDTKTLKELLNLGVGGYISDYLISTKLNQLKDEYAEKGYFQAEISYEQTFNDDSTEATLKYIIDEKSKVKVEKVVLTGNVIVEADKAVKKLRNRKRGFLKSSNFAQDKYEDDKQVLIEEFHNKGFIDAYLISDSTTIDAERNRMTIFYNIYEGPRYYFGKTEFVNNSELPLEILKKTLKYKEGDIFNIGEYDRSMEELYSAYYDIGHLHIRVLDERTTVDDTTINIKMDVSEGLPSHINLIKIVGNSKTKEKVVRRELSSMPGQKFTRALLIRSIRDVMALNYFTNVVPVPVNLPNGDVDVEFTVDEKQTGQVSAGAAFNSQDKLVGNFGMGIPNFRGVGQSLNFNMDFGSTRNSYSISFSEPWLFGKPTLFSTDIYSVRRQWYSDYTETRQGFSIKFGKRLRWPDNYFRVYASYRLERDKYEDFDESFVTSNSYKDYHRFYDVYAEDVYDPDDTTSILHHRGDIRQVFDRSDTLSDGSIINFYKDNILARSHLKEPYPGSILEFDDIWHVASRVSFTLRRDSRNLPEFATSGSDFSYTIEKTGGFLGGYWNYTKHSLSYTKFIPIVGKLALAAKIQFGGISTLSGTPDNRILLSDRFSPGGTAYDGIVRGYEDGSLTPDTAITFADTSYYYYDIDNVLDSVYLYDDDHNLSDSMSTSSSEFYTRVRGNYMLISNIELQFPLVEHSIYALLFFDAGNSTLKFKELFDSKDRFWYKSVGAGFRIAVPGIGTIGFDFGYALDEVGHKGQSNYQERGWKSHFQIGTTFR